MGKHIAAQMDIQHIDGRLKFTFRPTDQESILNFTMSLPPAPEQHRTFKASLNEYSLELDIDQTDAGVVLNVVEWPAHLRRITNGAPPSAQSFIVRIVQDQVELEPIGIPERVQSLFTADYA